MLALAYWPRDTNVKARSQKLANTKPESHQSAAKIGGLESISGDLRSQNLDLNWKINK